MKTTNKLSSGFFVMFLALAACGGGSDGGGKDVNFSDSFSGTLSPSDIFLSASETYADSAQIRDVPKGALIEITAVSDDFDIVVALYYDDEDGTPVEVEEDDDSAGDGNASLSATAPRTDDYLIIITSYEVRATGDYNVNYSASTGDDDDDDDDNDDDDDDDDCHEICSMHSHPRGDGTYYWEEECYTPC